MSSERAKIIALEFIREHGIFAKREVVREMLQAANRADASEEALYRDALDLLFLNETSWLGLTGLQVSHEKH